MPSRRAVLAAVVASLAGCSALGGDEERTVLDADIELEPGEYRAAEFSVDQERTVGFGISEVEDAELDVLLLSGEEFDAYAEGSEYEPRYTSGLGVSGGFAEDTVPAGAYAVVFDNTDRGDAVPEGSTVSGHAEVRITPPD